MELLFAFLVIAGVSLFFGVLVLFLIAHKSTHSNPIGVESSRTLSKEELKHLFKVSNAQLVLSRLSPHACASGYIIDPYFVDRYIYWDDATNLRPPDCSWQEAWHTFRLLGFYKFPDPHTRAISRMCAYYRALCENSKECIETQCRKLEPYARDGDLIAYHEWLGLKERKLKLQMDEINA